jgi:hypothetical protein
LRPTIASFTVTPVTLPSSGGQATLSWQVSGADTVSIDHGVGVVTGESIAVPVTAATTFTMTATNATGNSTATASVALGQGQGPTIGNFTATPATLPVGGGEVTLSWQVSGADTVSIDHGIGVVTGQSIAVPVTAHTTFTLTATNATGTSTTTASVALGQGHRPTVASFSATPATLPSGGGQVTLSWQVSGADTVSIDHGVGVVTGQGVTVQVASSTNYTLTATNASGSATATASVAVSPAVARPVIASFAATPTSLPVGGGAVALSWQVSNADTLSIDGGVGTVTGQSVSVNVGTTTTFTLTATNAGGTATASATVVVAAGPPRPTIARFSATPASVPASGGTVTLSWEVSDASSVSIDHGVGAVTGQSVSIPVSATTIYTLTATNAVGTATSSTAVVVGQNPSRTGTRFVAMVTPVGGESFTAPSTLRLVAAGRDPNIDTNNPAPGLGGNASKVQFFVDDSQVLEVLGSQAEFWIFKGFVANVAAGGHRVWARAIYVNPDLVLDSAPVLIRVDPPPTYGQTVDLTADLTVTGTSYSLVGTPTARVRVNGNGHRIASAAGASTAIEFRYVDFFDLGDRTSTSTPGVDLTTSGALAVENCRFDGSNTVQLAIQGTATASIKGNTFRSNMRQPLGQQPDYASPGSSYPVLVLGGSSTSTSKVVQGNNIAAGWLLLTRTSNWLVGGDSDAAANVLIGARVGIFADPYSAVGNITIRRNYAHHIYYGGWSQGSNFELGGAASVLAEHNVIAGSSWPVRGVGGELRYNLILEGGHEWVMMPNNVNGGFVHHNLMVGGELDQGGFASIYGGTSGVRAYNNTLDGMNSTVGAIGVKGGGSFALNSNLIMNFAPSNAHPVVTNGNGGGLASDYNLFWNVNPPNYDDGRAPSHDKTANPLLTSPVTVQYDFDETAVWSRTLTVREILSRYRSKYTPGAGSPAIDAGDPATFGAGNDIGAIGAGAPNDADRFGTLLP